MFLLNAFSDFKQFIFWITIILVSVCFHEFCHAYAAHLNGDDTAKNRGFFTINPIIQMGPQSLILLFFFGMCWGACPVNPNNFKNKYSDAYVSFAGPLGNLVLAVIFALFTCILYSIDRNTIFLINLYDFVFIASIANSALFLLNLFPIPPLDGYSILTNVFPKFRILPRGYEMLGIVLLIAICYIPDFWSFLYSLAYNLSNGIFSAFYLLVH